ncbi:MaoC family dehydratase [Pseudochrobactrum kiredjianiae]|uniref:MaoC family dehydratase n=1 Tax=Pseudochrobactrum kiredjianiae TaxID=386305 RepID=A0ABW3V656_9HYPH|nr:MaoC family dehydratase [Pseudochrobactrum kiredjianiae]MDM7851022.1 MaoC family dehydratase [Pseudochrobactrum kiredjianiae]
MEANSKPSILEDNIGKIVTIGSYEFTEARIIRFAEKYDPQVFHTDPIAAKTSLFGGLCASGWHTTAVWMRLNVQSMAGIIKGCMERGETPPVFGPSPGFENLRWAHPVYADDVIAYTAQITALRPLASKPGWSMLSHHATGTNQHGERVMEFDGAALVMLPQT